MKRTELRNDTIINDALKHVLPIFKRAHQPLYDEIKYHLEDRHQRPIIRSKLADIKEQTFAAKVVHDVLCEKRLDLKSYRRLNKVEELRKDGFIYKEKAIDYQSIFREQVIDYIIRQNEYLKATARKKIRSYVLENSCEPLLDSDVIHAMRVLRKEALDDYQDAELLLNLIIDPSHYFPASLLLPVFDFLDARELVTLRSFANDEEEGIVYE